MRPCACRSGERFALPLGGEIAHTGISAAPGESPIDRPEWLDLLGGTRAMIEAPFIQELVAESQRVGRAKSLVGVLKVRFGTVPPTTTSGLEQINEEEKWDRLTGEAVTCRSLQAFEEALRKELPLPPPASTRGKRRPRKPAE